MKPTLKLLLSRIEDWCDNHTMVTEFSHGLMTDIELGNKRTNWVLVHVVVQPPTIQKRGVLFNVDFVIMGMTQQNPTTSQEGQDSLKQVQSDLLQIVQDFVAEITFGNSYFYYDNQPVFAFLNENVTISAEPFIEDFNQWVTGYTAPIEIWGLDPLNQCDVPYLGDYSPPEPGGPCSVEITNTSGTVLATVSDDYQVPDTVIEWNQLPGVKWVVAPTDFFTFPQNDITVPSGVSNVYPTPYMRANLSHVDGPSVYILELRTDKGPNDFNISMQDIVLRNSNGTSITPAKAITNDLTHGGGVDVLVGFMEHEVEDGTISYDLASFDINQFGIWEGVGPFTLVSGDLDYTDPIPAGEAYTATPPIVDVQVRRTDLSSIFDRRYAVSVNGVLAELLDVPDTKLKANNYVASPESGFVEVMADTEYDLDSVFSDFVVIDEDGEEWDRVSTVQIVDNPTLGKDLQITADMGLTTRAFPSNGVLTFDKRTIKSPEFTLTGDISVTKTGDTKSLSDWRVVFDNTGGHNVTFSSDFDVYGEMPTTGRFIVELSWHEPDSKVLVQFPEGEEEAASIIIGQDDFSVSPIGANTDRTVTDPDGIFSIASGKLEINTSSSVTSRDNRVEYTGFVSTGTHSVLTAEVTGSTDNAHQAQIVLFEDNDNRVQAQQASGNFWRVVCRVGGSNVYDFTSTVSVATNPRVKIVREHSSGDVSFYYWSGTSWTQIGATQSSISISDSSHPYLTASSSNATATTWEIDNMSMCSEDYSTATPT